jgi:hypothetical protein
VDACVGTGTGAMVAGAAGCGGGVGSVAGGLVACGGAGIAGLLTGVWAAGWDAGASTADGADGAGAVGTAAAGGEGGVVTGFGCGGGTGWPAAAGVGGGEAAGWDAGGEGAAAGGSDGGGPAAGAGGVGGFGWSEPSGGSAGALRSSLFSDGLESSLSSFRASSSFKGVSGLTGALLSGSSAWARASSTEIGLGSSEASSVGVSMGASAAVPWLPSFATSFISVAISLLTSSVCS